MKDCTFDVLRQFQNSDLTEAEIARRLEFPVTIESLIYRKLISQHFNIYGDPINKYRITDEGREFVRQRLEENRRATRDFWLSFLSGTLVGVAGTLLVQWIFSII